MFRQSLHLRLGEKLETDGKLEFTEDEIWAEILRQKEKKAKKRLKKEKKEKKKKKGEKKEKELESGKEEEEDIFEYFEKVMSPVAEERVRSRYSTQYFLIPNSIAVLWIRIMLMLRIREKTDPDLALGE